MTALARHWTELMAATVWVAAWTWIAWHIRTLRARAAAGGGESLWADAWSRLAKNWMAVISAWTIFVIGLACLVGPWWFDWMWGFTYNQDLSGNRDLFKALPPSWTSHHWFGTDVKGRDLLVRILTGGQISITVGLVGGAVAATVGTLYGAISGYAGGKTDDVMMRIVEALYSLPFMLIVIVLGAVLRAVLATREGGQASGGTEAFATVIVLFIAIGLVAWPTLARVIRGQVLSVKQREFVLAAHAIGTSPWQIIRWHLIPNILGIAVVYTTLTMPSLVLFEALLAYLGLGAQPPLASWGSLIADGAAIMEVYVWLLIFPATIMCVTLFAFNFLGDGLRDALDPKLRGVD
ncbi:MAG: ABC transporter permease subunit [bacterium]|nr:ABC transporter permease subunit [bacterium]